MIQQVVEPDLVTDRIGRILMAVSKWLGAFGGLVFCLLTVMQLISIVGRKLFAMPVPGGFEITEMAAAGAVASCFAFCHLQADDVKIDFFTNSLGVRTNLVLDAVGSLGVGALGAVLGCRALTGAFILHADGEVSPILAWPIWAAQAGMLPGFFLLTIVGLYMAVKRVLGACRFRRMP